MRLHSLDNQQQSLAAIAQPGERQTEDLQVPGFDPGSRHGRVSPARSLLLARYWVSCEDFGTGSGCIFIA